MSTPSGGVSIGTLEPDPSALLPHVTIGTHMHARGGVKIAASRSASAALKKHSPPPPARTAARPQPAPLSGSRNLPSPAPDWEPHVPCAACAQPSLAQPTRAPHWSPWREPRLDTPRAAESLKPQALGAFGAKVEVMASDLALRSRRSAAARATASCFSCTSGLRATPQLSARAEGGQRRQRAAAPQCVVLLVHLCEAAFQPPALLVLLSHSAARDAGEVSPRGEPVRERWGGEGGNRWARISTLGGWAACATPPFPSGCCAIMACRTTVWRASQQRRHAGAAGKRTPARGGCLGGAHLQRSQLLLEICLEHDHTEFLLRVGACHRHKLAVQVKKIVAVSPSHLRAETVRGGRISVLRRRASCR